MKPLNFTTQNQQLLTIVPDGRPHTDGHPVLTHTYSIFQGHSSETRLAAKRSSLHMEEHNDPNYLGFITFVKPGKMFTYTPHGDSPLEAGDIMEIVEFLSDIRDNPSSWRLS